eukprot:1329952-Pyramimonas_sp.AAC.1
MNIHVHAACGVCEPLQLGRQTRVPPSRLDVVSKHARDDHYLSRVKDNPSRGGCGLGGLGGLGGGGG